MLISNVLKSIIVVNSLDTRFSRNVFEAVQKNSQRVFYRLRLVVLNPDKTLLLVFQKLLISALKFKVRMPNFSFRKEEGERPEA